MVLTVIYGLKDNRWTRFYDGNGGWTTKLDEARVYEFMEGVEEELERLRAEHWFEFPLIGHTSKTLAAKMATK
jgi:hypothetical protein